MKKITLGIILGLSIALGFSFKTIYDLKTTSAEVNIYEDLAVFMDCEPLLKYEVIGEVKLPTISSNDDTYFDARNAILKKCKKTYPTAQAIIIDTKGINRKYESKVITFKK